jgi:hypothetical protein
VLDYYPRGDTLKIGVFVLNFAIFLAESLGHLIIEKGGERK